MTTTQRITTSEGHTVDLVLEVVNGQVQVVSETRVSAADDLIASVKEAVDEFLLSDVKAAAEADEQMVTVPIGTRKVVIDDVEREEPVTVQVRVPPPVIRSSITLLPNAAARLANTIVSRLRARGVAI